MSAVAEVPRKLRLERDGEDVDVRYVGTSLHGWIYRAEGKGSYYRLVSAKETRAAHRNAFRASASQRNGKGSVSICRSWQSVDLERDVIEYATSDTMVPLANELQAPAVVARLRSFAAVLEACAEIELESERPYLHTPADFLIDRATGKAAVLTLPFQPVPGIDTLLDEPRRALYLAPEYWRDGISSEGRRPFHALERFSLGVMLLECVRTVLTGDPLASATRLSLDDANLRPSIPAWMEHLDATERVVQLAQQWTAFDPECRGAVDLEEARTLLARCIEGIDPLEAIHDAQRRSRLEALRLTRDILRDGESYDLLMEAGELATDPLETLDFFERAITSAPDPETKCRACIAHLQAIRSASTNRDPVLRDLYVSRVELAVRLDAQLARDFEMLDESDPANARMFELDVALHYLWRGAQQPIFHTNAATFIRPRLFDKRGGHIPGKFLMNLAFAESLLGQGRISEASQQLALVKQLIARLGSRRDIPMDDPHRALERLKILERQITS